MYIYKSPWPSTAVIALAVYMNDVYSYLHACFAHGMLKVVQVVWENNYTSIFMYPVYIY